MPTIQQFLLPDAGEGLSEAEIVSWRVRPGDTVAVNDALVEIETAKSLVELPSPFAGMVVELLVPEGATVLVGSAIISIDVEPGGHDVEPEGHGVEPEGQPDVLVGYGPRPGTASRRPVLAKPPVRKAARDLGVDLSAVPASGPGGVVTHQDVRRYASSRVGTAEEVPVEPAEEAPVRPVTGAPGERETRIPVRGVRKATATAMVSSAFTAPHVTVWVQVDVTRTMKSLRRTSAGRAFDQVTVSPLVPVARAVVLSLHRHPAVNACWDEAAGEIVLKHYVHLGIAVATDRGLIVPTIHDADRLSAPDLARAISDRVSAARDGRSAPADLTGGTFTITNVGVFGVDGGTPILPPGQAAILALGQIRQLPWVHKGRIRPRWVTTLAISFDHRMIDGELGSRFLADVATLLHDPSTALVGGISPAVSAGEPLARLSDPATSTGSVQFVV